MSTELATQQGNEIGAIAKLPPHLAIMKMENESIMSMAVAHPRNFITIKAGLLEQLKAFPVMAEDAIYEKPCGKDQDTGKQKIATGLSIRAAEAIAEAYGYNRVRCDVTPIDEDTVKVEATFTDYQGGRIWQDGGIVSRVYKAKGGGSARHPDDRFYGVVLKAEASRRIREVILRSVSPGLKAWYEEQAAAIGNSTLNPGVVAKIVDGYKARGVTPEMLETYLGKTRAAGWLEQDQVRLRRLWKAIETEETTIAEAFGLEQKEPEKRVKSADPLPEAPKKPVETAQQSEEPKPEARDPGDESREPVDVEPSVRFRSISEELSKGVAEGRRLVMKGEIEKFKDELSKEEYMELIALIAKAKKK